MSDTPADPSPPKYVLKPLRKYDHAEYHPWLIHMPGRTGNINHDDSVVLGMTPGQKLVEILAAGCIRAFPMFGTNIDAVCFTESSRSALNWMFSEGTYKPWGVVFSKDCVFRHNGAPVIEVRGDEWAQTDTWPVAMRARLKRLWPGVEQAPLGTPPHEIKESQWSFEREWRIPRQDFTFQPEDVLFTICPDDAQFEWLCAELGARNQPMRDRVATRPRLTWDAAAKELVPEEINVPEV